MYVAQATGRESLHARLQTLPCREKGQAPRSRAQASKWPSTTRTTEINDKLWTAARRVIEPETLDLFTAEVRKDDYKLTDNAKNVQTQVHTDTTKIV